MNVMFPPSHSENAPRLIDIFLDEAAQLGISAEKASQLFSMIPLPVKSAKVSRSILGDWRYIYGDLFHAENRPVAFGVPFQSPLVASLVRTALVADKYLTVSQQRRGWWYQMEKTGKHFDAITEMLAVVNVPDEFCPIYEPSNFGNGAKKIDWLITTNNKEKFLLEVKNRPKQLLQEIMRMRTESTYVEPVIDFDMLFKSTTEKFLQPSESSCIQGTMIFLALKIPGDKFEKYYHEHLEDKLDYVAFGKEDKDAGIRINLFARTQLIAERVLNAFKWSNDADLIN